MTTDFASPSSSRLIVKRNGVVATERGIGTHPPVGRHGSWPIRVRAVVRDLPDRWLVELAIPLAGFDARAMTEPVWGFNLARFCRWRWRAAMPASRA